ncbi:DUF5801 repeats-in-toxin domain-containing protein, partial [Bradyrhizobium sp. DOA9]|uniref:DUF5801 repeats-in-toxin domain-containing protein n=1 Tax=Bradyrhizobium sp. DOA9 TaxID=1126627 RepID=UPI000468728D
TPSLASTTVSGLLPVTLNVPGGVQSLTFALSVSSPGVDSGLIDSATGQHVLLSVGAGGVVEGRTAGGGALVFTVSVDAAGNVTLTELRAVHELTPGDSNEGISLPAGLVTLTVTVTDNSNQSSSASVDVGPHLTILDDGPVAAIAATEVTVTVDESAGVQGNEVAGPLVFAGVANPGTDLPAAQYAQSVGAVVSSAGSVTGADGAKEPLFSLAIANANSGLTTTDGHAIQLFLENGIVVGRYDSNGSGTITAADNAAFAVAIDASTGVLSVVQYVSLHHDSPDTPADISEALNLGSTINAVVTVTDGDGDVATSSTAIGSAVHLLDDGPFAAIAVTEVTVTVDESAGVQGNEVAGPLVFAGVANPGTDLPAAQYAQSVGAVVSSAGSAVGADQEGATTLFSLAIANANSGLTTTDGHAIQLFLENGIVVGRYDSNGSGTITAADNAAFAVAIDASTGVLSVVQYVSLHHDSPDTPADISEALNLGSTINAVVTVTDGDGDVATSSTAIGSAVRLLDDGPFAAIAVTEVTVTVDESAGVQGNEVAGPLVFAGVANPGTDLLAAQYAQSVGAVVSSAGSAVGADQEGATTLFSLAIANANSGLTTTDGHAIQLFLENGIVVGRYDSNGSGTITAADNAAFAVAIDASTGVLSVVQYVSLHHDSPDTPADISEALNLGSTINAVVTVTDGDGDVATSSTAIGSAVHLLDDGPFAAIAVTEVTVTVDESAGVQGNEVAGPLVFAGVANPGTDLPAAQYAQSVGAVVSSAGSAVGADQEGATTLFSLAIANANSGLTTTDGHAIQLFLENGIVVGRYDSNGSGTITAADNAAFAVAIDASTGVLSVVQYVSLHHDSPDTPADISEALNLGSTINAVVTVTDGDGDVATSSTAIGSAVRLLDDGPFAAIAVTEVTVTVDESAGVQGNEVAGPLVFAGVANPGTDLLAAQYAQSVGAVVSSAGSAVGADQEGATTLFSLAIANANSGLTTTDGHAIQLFLENGIVVGRYDSNGSGTITAADNAAFAVAIDASTGVLSVVQYVSLHHDSPDTPADISEALNLGSTINAVVTVTDGDGDVATSSTAIGSAVRLLDDGPFAAIAVTEVTVTVDESAGVQGNEVAGPLVFAGVANPGTDLPAAQYAQSVGAVVSSAGSAVGADQEGATTLFSLAIANANSGLTTTDGHAIQLFLENGIVVGRYDSNGSGTITAADNAAFAVAIDASTGVLSVVQYVSLHHNSPDTPADISEALNLGSTINAVVTVTDGDGDVATSSTAIGSAVRLLDDGPFAAIAVTEVTVTVDESAGVQGNEVAGPLVFAGVANPGTDLPAAQYAQSVGAVVSSAGSAVGADQEGATTLFSLAIANANSGLTTTDGHAIQLFLENGIVVGRYDSNGSGTITAADNAAFAVAIDASTGVLSVVQYVSLHHNSPDTPADISEALNLGSTINAVVTVTDGDGDVATSSTAIGSAVRLLDDGPFAAIAVTEVTVTVDESAGVQGNEVAGPLVFAGVANPGTDLPAAQYAQSVGAVVSSAGSAVGADQEGATTLFSLAIANANSGLTTTDGHAIQLFLENGIVVGRYDSNGSGTITAADNAAFAVAIDASTGVLSVVQYVSLHHNSPDTPADISEALNLGSTINAVVTVTDGDGDVATSSTAIGSAVRLLDDGPKFISSTNLIFANSTGVGTGIYQYNIGADNYTAYDLTHSDFGPITLSGSVAANAITNSTVTWSSETASSAV